MCALALALPGAAAASATQEALLQDDDQFLYHGPERANESLDQVRDLGVEIVRVSIHWRNVAPHRREDLGGDPADPARYDDSEFDAIDHVLRAARARGIRVLVTVTGPAPDWAVRRPLAAGRHGIYKPRAGEYGAFVEMLGRRWSGSYRDENQGGDVIPRADAWSLWNEPNWHASLMPQWVTGPRGERRPHAGRHYRALHRAAVAGLERAGHGGDTILLGETAPMGSKFKRARSPLKPGVFLRQLLCLRRDLRPMRGRQYRRNGCDFHRLGPLKATGYAHHPYPVKSPPQEGHPDPDRFKLADAPELLRLLDAAAAAGRIAPQLPLWYTEFGWQTEPDPIRGISLLRHARWLGEAERMSYRQPRVAVHGNFLLRDDEPRTHEPPGSNAYWTTWQSGLLTQDGTPKPAYDAFRLPLVAPRTIPPGSPLELWGVVRPADHRSPTRVTVQRRARADAPWEDVGQLTVADPRAFTATIPEPRPGDYRIVWQPPAPAARKRLLFEDVPSPAPAPVVSSPVYVGVG
jgi:hypothetical protein